MVQNHYIYFLYLAQNMEEGVVIEDERGKVLQINPSFCKYFSLSPDTPEEISYPQLVEKIKPFLSNPRQFANLRDTLISKRKEVKGQEVILNDGRILLQDYIPVFEDNVFKGNIWIYHHLTHRQKAQKHSKEVNSTLPPTGKAGAIRLEEIIDIRTLQSLIDDFHKLTGIGMAIIDLKGNILAKTGFQKICWDFHRAHPKSRKHCIESDRELARYIEPGQYKLYKCKNNMWDVATPVYAGDSHVANLFSGQFFFEDEEINLDTFKKQAQKYGFNQKEYLQALKEVPRWSREKLEAVIRFFNNLGDIISQLSHSNIRLARLLSEREKVLTERKKVEENLRKNEKRLSQAHSFANAGSWEYDLNTDSLYWSKECEALFGLDEGEFKGTSKDFLRMVYPADRSYVKRMNQPVIRQSEDKPLEYEFRIIRKDGNIRWVRESAGVIRDKNGKPVRKVGLIMDITRHKRMETERKELEAQLRQVQKMEAVGRLAGGVAHDFNNMLGVIMGNVEMALNKIESKEPLFQNLKEIQKAAQQSARLTGQLLAFARKQTVKPQALDLNKTLSEMLAMLGRIIGENIDLKWLPASEVTPVKIDPGQVHQILANLCVNARDAIKGKGQLTIRTENIFIDTFYSSPQSHIKPGKYVLLSISDNGCGMKRETLHKIFDPFFTTKEAEKGTGLGLPTVYGIIRQNNGFIDVDSTPGKGTTFKIYLPRHQGEVESKKQYQPTVEKGGSETILIVEDDPQILSVAKMILEDHGYKVLSAEKPREALSLCDSYDRDIHLLITDLIMPQMNGKELQQAIQKMKPRIKVLYMSGYTSNVITHNNILDTEAQFIQKPFTIKDFCNKVRSILDKK